MDVRVCGPNLRDQSKGTFHVHADGCRDLRKYGPQYRGKDGLGGDLNGNLEMLIKNATVMAVVRKTYADQIAENPDAEAELDMYVNDFWFAPCCKDHLEYSDTVIADAEDDLFASDGMEDHIMSGPTVTPKLPLFDSGDSSLGEKISEEFGSVTYERDVFECWVADKRDSFKQVYTREELNAWLDEHFDSLGMHERISIVKHALTEYES